MWGLIGLGFTLSWDNFRSALVLGGLKPTFAQSLKTSVIFGLWDGLAPVVGILIGDFVSNQISNTSDTIATIGLAVYGAFLIIRAVISPERADPDLKWARFGLPLPLSIDNVAAGAALGLHHYSEWLAPALFVVITFLMSVVGHQLGRMAASSVSWFSKINTDLLTGIGFAAMALLLALGVNLPPYGN
ncbi:MAG: manganese efflux pump [Solirubrobacterales bacterium]|nr:manganese efflux pump [Solirubrobacterales bacterium]